MVIYFSGTGNSEYVARAIADRLSDETVSANEYIKGHRAGDFYSDCPWVFVFPIYLSTIAQIFADFLRQSSFSGNRKAYFIATCSSAMGITPNVGAELCAQKQLEFMGAEKVIMPQNYIALFPMTAPEQIEARQKNALASADAICRSIAAGEALDKAGKTPFETRMTLWVERLYNRHFTKTRKFRTTDLCIGCGLCAAVCPLNNITLAEERPQWGKSCVHCMSCINRCPKAAIEYGKSSAGKARYVCVKYRP